MAEQLTLSQIAEAVNNNKGMRAFFSTYLRGKGKDGKLNNNDVRQLLNTPLSSVFKKMFITAVTTYESISENIRANIREIIKVEENSEQANQSQDDDPDSNVAWGSIDNDGPKLQLTPRQYTDKEIAERLVECSTMLGKRMLFLPTLLAKFQLMFSQHRQKYIDLAEEQFKDEKVKLVLSPMHARKLYNTHRAYQLTPKPAQKNQIVEKFATLQGAKLPIAQLHRFFQSPSLKKSVNQHRKDRKKIEQEMTKTNDHVIYYQQACIRLRSPINYVTKQLFMRNPNFVNTLKPNSNKYEPEQGLMTPFRTELTPEPT